MEEPILISTVSNSSEIELSDGHSLGSVDGEAHLPLGASPRRAHSSSRQPGVATIEEGEEGPFGSVKADSRAASPREVRWQALRTCGVERAWRQGRATLQHCSFTPAHGRCASDRAPY